MVLSSFFTGGLLGLSVEKKMAFDSAAKKLQNAVRIYQAKEKSRKLLRLRYIKLYDNITDEYVYKDKLTGYIHMLKPSILGERDLPTPPMVIAPDDYNPGYDAVYKDGHALVITVSSFVYNDLIPDLPAGVIAEHDVLKEVLSHDFICKFCPDNVTSLFNPSCEQFAAAFKVLQKVCKTNDYLLVYICTHIGTAYKGEKNSSESGYILMNDSKWRKPEDIAKSSISISTLGKHLNKVLCREKTVVLNCAHQDRPPPRFFAAKVLYPPRNGFSRLADIANCVVIGNCAVGALVSDVINHTVLPRQPVGVQASKSFSDMLMGTSKTATPTAASSLNNDDITDDSKRKDPSSLFSRIRMALASIAATADNIKLRKSSSNRILSLSKTAMGEGKETPSKAKRNKKESPEAVQFVSELSSAAALEIFNKNINDWKVVLKPDFKISPPPEGPKLAWSKVDAKVGGLEFKFDIPTERDFTKYKIKKLQWRINWAFGPPSNFIRRKYRKFEDKRRTSPSEVGLLHETGTLFGSAFIAALKGGASSSTTPLVTTESLFLSIVMNVKDSLKQSPHKYDTIAFQRGLLTPEALIIADKKVAKQLKKDEKLKKLKRKELLRKNELDHLKAMRIARKKGLKAPRRILLDQEESSSIIPFNQNPVMTVPRTSRFGVESGGILKAIPVTQSNSQAVLHTVSVSCSPPPAPLKPIIESVGPNDVMLRWSDPPFSGVNTTAYRIFFRNESRNFHEWQLLPNVGQIKTSFYHIRNLTRGVSCQFRVKAFNNGGWGDESEPSDEVCPGSGYTTISTAARRSRLSMGGPLAILDRLELLPMTRDEHLWGLSRLRSMVQIASGYKKGNVQVKVALAAIHALKTFPADTEMAGAALSLLGWTLVGPATEQVINTLKKNNIIELAIEYMAKYRKNCDVIGAVTWLRCNMPPGSIPQPPVVHHKVTVLNIVKKDELVDTDEEDNALIEEKEGKG